MKQFIALMMMLINKKLFDNLKKILYNIYIVNDERERLLVNEDFKNKQ